MLRVFVALGKQMPKNKAMIEDTKQVARLLAKYNCTMVQGGARVGLMGVILEEFQKFSDDVVLIVPEVHKNDLKGTTSKEHYIVDGEADRLKITISTCDMMVVLAGGTGTLAELTFYNETRKSGEHQAKLVMVNTKGFYNKYISFVKTQTKAGFMKKEHFKYDVIKNAAQLEAIIKELITQKQTEIQQAKLQAEAKANSKKRIAKKPIKKGEEEPKTRNTTKQTKVEASKPKVKTATKKVKTEGGPKKDKKLANKMNITEKVLVKEVKSTNKSDKKANATPKKESKPIRVKTATKSLKSKTAKK